MSSSELIGPIRINLHMSNSDQLVLVPDHHHQDDEFGKDRPLDHLLDRRRDDRQSSPGPLSTPSDQEDHHHHHHNSADHDQDHHEAETASSSSVAEEPADDLSQKVDENDDGFRTPTSSEHKIPAMKQCPPAPRKPKPSAKRKPAMASPIGAGRSAACRNLSFDFSEREFESMFPSARESDQFVLKFKKPRRDIEEKD